MVGNRGMGKSFWAHALADAAAREKAATTFRELTSTDVRIGFNASERSESHRTNARGTPTGTTGVWGCRSRLASGLGSGR